MLFIKKFTLFATFMLAAQAISAQKLYIKLGGSLNVPTSYTYEEQITEHYNYQRSATIKASLAKQNYGKGKSLNGTVGYNFNKHFGLELGVSYLINSVNKREDIGFVQGQGMYAEYHFKQESQAKMWLFQPGLVASLGREKLNPYIRLGLVIPKGKIFTQESYTSYNIDQKGEMETKGALHIGFQEALGLELEARKNIHFFAEINFINLAFVPETKTLVKATLNGEDVLNKLTVREKETEFVETVTENYTYDQYNGTYKYVENKNSPKQVLQKNYTLNTVNFGLGLRVNI